MKKKLKLKKIEIEKSSAFYGVYTKNVDEYYVQLEENLFQNRSLSHYCKQTAVKCADGHAQIFFSKCKRKMKAFLYLCIAMVSVL